MLSKRSSNLQRGRVTLRQWRTQGLCIPGLPLPSCVRLAGHINTVGLSVIVSKMG